MLRVDNRYSFMRPFYAPEPEPSPAGRAGMDVVPPAPRPGRLLAASSCFSVLIPSTYLSMSSTGSSSRGFPGAEMAISIFFAPVCTTSKSDLTVNLIVSSRSSPSLWFRSRNSRTVLLDRPMAFAFLYQVSTPIPSFETAVFSVCIPC